MGFNSPPDFTGPMSNRSDISENDKQRLVLMQRQQSSINSPQGIYLTVVVVVSVGWFLQLGCSN